MTQVVNSIGYGDGFQYNLSSPVVVNTGDTMLVNGTPLTYDGHGWNYGYNTISSGSISGTWIGDDMANSTPNLYGDLLFTRGWTYENWTVTNVKTGKVAGKAIEISREKVNGLGSAYSLYSIAGTDDKPTYPYLSWNALLEKLGG
jgi:hypothetical protein